MIITDRINGLSNLIGNTPMLEITYKYKGDMRRIFAKAENMNMTGSIKDRMAFHILKKATKKKVLKDGYQIIEATSGNTGISFAALGKALGYKVKIFMPEWMSTERINLIKSLGADIRLVSKEEGGFLGSIRLADECALQTKNSFLPCQFSNVENIEAHYLTTGPEIWWQLQFRSLTPDAFIAGIGTGGTIMGVGKFLKEQNNNVLLFPLEPLNSPTLSTGHKVGKHRIQGISDEFIPSIVKLNELNEVIAVDDGDAIIIAQKLASEIGIGVGISSGANFIGAVMLQNKLGSDKVIVTIFPDDNKKYLSTDLLKKETEKSSFISKDIELISFKALKRVCQTCCTPEDCYEAQFSGKLEIKTPNCPRRN